MLLNKCCRYRNHYAKCGNCEFSHRLQSFLLEPHGHNSHGVSNMKRRANARRRIKLIYKSHYCRENVMTGKFIGAKILYARIKDIAYHSDNLCTDDKGLQLFETLDIIEQKIKKACRYQKIPRNIEYNKVLVERYYIIKHAVHNVTAIVRYQIFRQKIKKKINKPSRQKQKMRIFGTCYVI